jgi:putative SOS response-associated peptidase YedK
MRFGLLASFLRRRPAGAPVINARSETAWDKPMFRASLARRRCIIPADGFYEWRGQAGDKQPYFIHAHAGGPIAMAGLWDIWRDPAAPQDEAIESAAILTCPANDVLRPLHDRMPVILAPKDWPVWLDPHSSREVLQGLCAPAPAGLLDAYPVSRRVGSVKNDDRDLIAPLEQTRSGATGLLL